MRTDELSRRRGNVKARIVSRPSIANPLDGPPSKAVTQVKSRADDGFGLDVDLVAECDDGHGGEHEPHLAIRMSFHQQHAAEVRGSAGADVLVVEQPVVTLHAWGGEAMALPEVLRKAADAAEAALKAHTATWSSEAA